MRSGLDLANPLRASFGKIFQQNYKIMLLGIDAPGEICFAPMGIARKNWLGLLGGMRKKSLFTKSSLPTLPILGVFKYTYHTRSCMICVFRVFTLQICTIAISIPTG